MINWIKINKKEIKTLKSKIKIRFLLIGKKGEIKIAYYDYNYEILTLFIEPDDFVDLKDFTHYAHINLP